MSLPFKTLDDVEYAGKKIIMRADMNCSVDPETREITDSSRIEAILPTLNDLSSSAVVLMAHQGRPGSDDFISLQPHAEILQDLGINASFVDDIFGEKAKSAIDDLNAGQVLVLQNVRYFDGELKKGPVEEVAKEPLVQELYPLFDLFVNDAFGAAHRSQASLVGFTLYLPSVAGRLMEKEIRTLTKAVDTESHPWTLVLGGAKVEDKVKTLEKLLKTGRVDHALLGGLVATALLVSSGKIAKVYSKAISGFNSIHDSANMLLEKYADTIMLPVDAAVERDGSRVDCSFDKMSEDPFYDVGAKTIQAFKDVIEESAVVFANGPMGFFEKEQFALGTEMILRAITTVDGVTVVGGGHLGAMAKDMELEDKVSHISTGGGSTINFLTGKKLEVVQALEKAAERMSGK
jgi:phosphoglycerate kinase